MSDVRLKSIREAPAAIADIVFVHGLGGDPDETWMVPNHKDTFWPEWVYEDFARTSTPCSVWTLGYPASPTAWKGRGDAMELPARAQSVLGPLVIAGIGKRPVVFIAHSLGGLLVKYVLDLAWKSKDAGERALAHRTQGVVFMATPHQGSDLATLVRGLRLARPTDAIRDLHHYSAYLDKIDDSYQRMTEELQIRTLAFRENRKLVPSRFLKMLPQPSFWVVDPASADPHIPGRAVIPIDADHFEICKPCERKATVYLHVKAFLAETLPESRLRQTEEDLISFLGGIAKEKEHCLCVLSSFRDSETKYRTTLGDRQTFTGSTVSPEDTSAAVFLCSLVSRVRGFDKLDVCPSDKVEDRDLEKHLLLIGSSLTNAHTKWALSSKNARYHFGLDDKGGFRIECRVCKDSGKKCTWVPNDGNKALDREYASGKATKIDYAMVQRLKWKEYEIFVLAGLGPVGTKGAAYFVYKKWAELHRVYRDLPFGVILRFGDEGQDPKFNDPVVVHRTDPDCAESCTNRPLLGAIGKAA